MTSVVPTVTSETPEAYNLQLQEVRSFARRLHIDLMDGQFAPNISVDFDSVWWPADIRVDLHVMFAAPFRHTALLCSLSPALVIVHAEADGDFAEFARAMHRHGIETGIALLPQTPVAKIIPALDMIDHALIFSGNLGHQGGSTADLKLLDKVRELRKAKPTLEIGWDGGVNDTNAAGIAAAGVDVLNVGGFIRTGHDPLAQYDAIVRATTNVG